MKGDQSLWVLDSEELLPVGHDEIDIVHWCSYESSDDQRVVSILQLVEEDDDHFRSAYLSFVYEMGELNINGKRLVDYLEISNDLSFWWMTLLTEKCNYTKSPDINNVIKLWALKRWLEGKSYNNIVLVSSNQKLIQAMASFSEDCGIEFGWKSSGQVKSSESILKRIYLQLPHALKALVWLGRYVVSHWPLRRVGVERWQNSKAKNTFISYLFNLDYSAVKSGHFASKYWTNLIDLLDQENTQTNWLHLYVKEGGAIKQAKKTIINFNQFGTTNQNHVMLDSFLDFGVVWKSLKSWWQLVVLEKRLRSGVMGKCDYLWPLFKYDFQTSLKGVNGMTNLVYFYLFEKAMRLLPTQDKGFYLQENQGWEFGFIAGWRAAKHKNKLFGIPHSTVRYWDLRYYFDPRSYHSSERCKIPLPDYVGANGLAVKKVYFEGGYPENDLVDVEALRYLHLLQSKENSVSKKTLLILGDYLKKNTIAQMELLQQSIKLIHDDVQYIVKPHPACPIKSEDYPELNMIVLNDPIPSLIGSCTLVYTSSTTSAAVDAYCAGRMVVTVLDPSGFNLSPLRGNEGVIFVSSPEELAMVINKMDEMIVAKGKGKDYFYLDTELPRWKKLLIGSNENMECGV